MGTTALRLLLTLPLLGAALLSACGGDKPSAPDAGQPPAAAVEPTENPNPWFLPTPKARATGSSAPAPTATSLLGRPNRDAARAITEAMKAAGEDPAGIEIFVFPIQGSDRTLLVFEIDGASQALSGQSGAPSAQDLFSASLFQSAAVKAAKASRVVLNIRMRDEASGEALIATLTLPLETMAGYLAGTLSEEQASQQTQFQVRQVQP